MVTNLKKNIATYITLIKLNFAMLFEYRANMMTSVLGSIIWGVFPILIMFLMTSRTTSFYGWKKDELFLLTGSYIFALGLFYMLFGKSFKRFSAIIYAGELDATLLKPIDSQFLISFWHMNFMSFFRIIFGLCVILYMIVKMHMQITLLSMVGFIVFCFSGLLILYSIWFITLTLTLWFVRLSNLREILLTLNGVPRFPSEMFSKSNNLLLLSLLPLTFVVATPTKSLLHKIQMNDVILLVAVSLFFFWLSRVFWKFALRYYTSASN